MGKIGEQEGPEYEITVEPANEPVPSTAPPMPVEAPQEPVPA